MIENKNEASRNLEKALQALEQTKQRVANENKKQNEKKRKAEVTYSPCLQNAHIPPEVVCALSEGQVSHPMRPENTQTEPRYVTICPEVRGACAVVCCF